MVGMGESAMVPQEVEQPRAVRASTHVNWMVAILMLAILIAAVAGVVVALSSGMPTIAILIALATLVPTAEAVTTPSPRNTASSPRNSRTPVAKLRTRVAKLRTFAAKLLTFAAKYHSGL